MKRLKGTFHIFKSLLFYIFHFKLLSSFFHFVGAASAGSQQNTIHQKSTL